jgi:AbrB family looped-hinge helix DNA binding protein
MFHKGEMQFYGTGTIGEKGQVVIPAKAREKLGIKPGDDFIFFGHGPVIHIVQANKINNILDKMAEKFTKSISGMREEIEKSSKDS